MYQLEDLKGKANNIRKNIVKTVTEAKSGHPGGSLSSVEIATAIYFTQMDITPDNVASTNRDRFVLSKGHASPLLYSVLAEKGLIEEEELLTFRKINILWKSIMYHICVIHVSIEQSFNKIASQITLAGFEKRTISYFNMLVICWS